MKLFLASRVVEPSSLKKLDEYVGGLRNKSIAYIPTAANAEDGWDQWRQGESWNTIQTLDANISLVLLEDIRSKEAVNMLRGKDIIWVAGGYCGYLMYWFRRCEIDKHIRELLSGNTVYIGSSAGAMVTASSLDIAEWYPGDLETGAGVIPGLGLVDFDFYPHFNEEHMEYIKSHYHGNKMYLLKN